MHQSSLRFVRLVVVMAAGTLSIACLRVIAQETVPETLPSSNSPGFSQSAPLPNGDPNQHTATLHVTTKLVVLDVVVTDKSGNLRNDLKKEDFQITEAGVPQTILHFEPPSVHIVPPGPPVNSTAELERRAPEAPVNVIVLDELNTRFQDMAFAESALTKYLNAQPGELQAPTMLLAVSKDRVQVVRDYTQDRGTILTALKAHLISYPWQLEAGVSVMNQLAQSIGALEQVAEATAGHPGHKNVIWVGHGFPGIDLSNPNLDQEGAKGINSAVQQAVNILRDSRITLYSIDPTALSSTVGVKLDDGNPMGVDLIDEAADPFLDSVNFASLAKATGGKAAYARNDVDAEIAESARDGVNYYTITYRPSGDSDQDKVYRKIRITFTDPTLHAGFRDGYYTRDDAQLNPAVKRSIYDTDSATESTLVYTGLTVQAISKPGQPGTYYVGLPPQELTWTDEENNTQSAKLTVIAAQFNAKGKMLRRVTNNMTAHRPLPQADKPSTGLVRVEVAVDPVVGANRIRFVVRAAPSGRIGTKDIRLPGTPPDAKPSR
jgi:VWFA-related protein